jgi:hypothetical protein
MFSGDFSDFLRCDGFVSALGWELPAVSKVMHHEDSAHDFDGYASIVSAGRKRPK